MPTRMQAMTLLLTAADPPITRKGGASRRNDAALIAAFLRKEPEAAGRLYDRFASRIYGLGLFLLHNRADAQDLVQDTFVKLWRSGSTFDPGRGSLDSWVLLTARGLAMDLLRRWSLEADQKLSANAAHSAASDETGGRAARRIRRVAARN